MDTVTIGLLIIGYFLVLIIVSALTGKKTDNETFFLGNRKSPWYIVSIGMIGSSLSGVTFISVPGWVGTSQFTYIQMVLGFTLGYVVIANILLPLYYRLNLTSIYTYLNNRFGLWSYKSGSLLFITSKLVGASARMYLMASVMQLAIADALNIPFPVTVFITIGLIWLYTFKGGIKTIIWTDALQTLLMLSALVVTIVYIAGELNLNFKSIITTVVDSPYSKIWVWNDWAASNHFIKQFFAGMFTTIVMTGLDQDMMQKNLTCKNIKDAKKNMYWYGFGFLPVNILFLSLGVLLFSFAAQTGIEIPARGDDLYPTLALGGHLPIAVSIFFILGLVAAAYSSADSALTSLTTSFSLDILRIDLKPKKEAKRIRFIVHIIFSVLIALLIISFRLLNSGSIIDTIYILAGYTYGPLLGLFSFGLFTKFQIRDKWVLLAVLLPPIITGILDYNTMNWFGFSLGYEKLILNGFITFMILLLLIKKKKSV
ncbi:MAG TPA: sodium:solute symporter [Marinilabiliaceae bacterium]|nr:sodium:solute symporter [Marinilabiliaceae bacterium]